MLKDEADRILPFFLEGATEPVALEVSFDLKDHPRDELLKKLAEYGILTSYDIEETDKVLVAKNSIITPPLKPEDIRPFFELMSQVLEEVGATCESTPHIIDLKAITPCDDSDLEAEKKKIREKYQDECSDYPSFEDYMIAQAQKSDTCIFVSKPVTKIPQEILQGFSERELVFNGSSISDPYRTATGDVKRNVRMASSLFGYALAYSHTGGDREKEQNSYQLTTPNGERFGFFHVYHVCDEQCYFSNTGIERGSSLSQRGAPQEETMVNRFKTPCVGEYLVLQEAGGYCLFPIPQDDERWQDFKKLSVRRNGHIDGLHGKRYDALRKSAENCEPKMPMIEEAYGKDGIKRDFYEKRIKAKKDFLDETKQQCEALIKSFTELDKKGQEIMASKLSSKEKTQQLKLLELEIQKKENEKRLLKARIEQLNYRGPLAFLQKEKEALNILVDQMNIPNFETAIANLKKIEEDKKRMQEKTVAELISAAESHGRFSTDVDLKALSSKTRADLADRIMTECSKKPKKQDIENLLMLYDSASSDEEKKPILKYLYKCKTSRTSNYGSQATALIADVIKKKTEFQKYPELVELSKKDNLFVKHSQKALRMFEKQSSR